MAELDSRIRIRAPLRCDGIGRLDCAEDTESGLRLAVRWLPLDANGDAAARACEKLPVHPTLPRIRQTGNVGGSAFVAMDFPDGQLLSTLVGAHVDTDVVLRVAAQMGEALAVVHEQQVVHGELSSESVLLVPPDQSYLWDMPLVIANRLTDRRGENRLMQNLVKTAPYLAPERAQGAGASSAADVYSLGAILCVAAGAPLPVAGTTLGVVHMVASGTWFPRVPTTIPDPWRTMLARMVATPPGARPTAREVARAFDRTPARAVLPTLPELPAVRLPPELVAAETRSPVRSREAHAASGKNGTPVDHDWDHLDTHPFAKTVEIPGWLVSGSEPVSASTGNESSAPSEAFRPEAEETASEPRTDPTAATQSASPTANADLLATLSDSAPQGAPMVAEPPSAAAQAPDAVPMSAGHEGPNTPTPHANEVEAPPGPPLAAATSTNADTNTDTDAAAAAALAEAPTPTRTPALPSSEVVGQLESNPGVQVRTWPRRPLRESPWAPWFISGGMVAVLLLVAVVAYVVADRRSVPVPTPATAPAQEVAAPPRVVAAPPAELPAPAGPPAVNPTPTPAPAPAPAAEAPAPMASPVAAPSVVRPPEVPTPPGAAVKGQPASVDHPAAMRLAKRVSDETDDLAPLPKGQGGRASAAPRKAARHTAASPASARKEKLEAMVPDFSFLEGAEAPRKELKPLRLEVEAAAEPAPSELKRPDL